MIVNKKQHIKELLIKALENNLGIVTLACKEVGINRTTFYQYVKDDLEFAKDVKEIESHALDFAESQLFKQMKDGSTSATIFYLKCKGKKRGYTENDIASNDTTIKVIRVDE